MIQPQSKVRGREGEEEEETELIIMGERREVNQSRALMELLVSRHGFYQPISRIKVFSFPISHLPPNLLSTYRFFPHSHTPNLIPRLPSIQAVL